MGRAIDRPVEDGWSLRGQVGTGDQRQRGVQKKARGIRRAGLVPQDDTRARHGLVDATWNVACSRQLRGVCMFGLRRMLQAMGWQGLPGSFWDSRFDSLCRLLAALFQM